MAEGQGYASYAGIGVQSTLGTNVTRTQFFDFISEGIELQQQQKQWNNAGESGERINTELGRHSEGSIEVYGNFEGLESVFKQAFGVGSVSSVNTAGAAWTHTFLLKDAVKSPGLSVEINRDVTAFLYEGMQVEETEFIQDAGDYLKIRFHYRGRDETQVSATSPTFATPLKIHHTQLVAKINTVVTTLNSYRLSMKNGLTGFRAQLGNKVTREIIRGGRRSVTGEVNLQFENLDRYNEFKAQSTVVLDLSYIGAVITGAETYKLQLYCPLANWTGRTPVVGGTGPIAFSMPFMAFMINRGANDEFAMFIENTKTSVT